MKIIYLVATVIILSPVFLQAAKKRFVLEIHNVTCQNYTNLIKQLKCGFIKVTKGHFFLNLHMMTNRNFGQNIDLRVLLHVKPWIGQKSFNFIDMKLNLCVAASEGFNNVMIKGFLNELKRASNFPLSCPFKGNFMYYIRNYTLTDEFIPPYSPYVNATYNLEFTEHNEIVATYIVNAELIPRK